MANRIKSAVCSVGLVGVLTVALGACGPSDGPGEQTADDPPNAAKGVAAAAPTPESVDVCALFTADDFASVVGEPAETSMPEKPQGSSLGGCTHFSKDASATVAIYARPSAEWAEARKLSGASPVAGVGEDAVWTDTLGLFVLPAGKPYHLQVMAVREGQQGWWDQDLSVAVAKVATGR